MRNEEPDPNQAALVKAQSSALMREPEGWQIREALYEVVEKIGRSPVTRQPDSTNWWEAFSHGLAQPMQGMPETGRKSDKGFLDRCTNSKAYLALESDFLRFDDHGFDRKFEGDPKGKPIVIGTDNRLKSLALRVVAFLKARADLQTQGFALPENPDLAMAIDAVRAELAKDVRAQAQFTRLLGDEKPQFKLRTSSDDTPSGMNR
jgi:hypothetical protein